MELDINRKQFNYGDVVWFLRMRPHSPLLRFGKYEIAWGILEENYPSTVVLQLYELFDTRLINDIPIKEFVTPTKWQKLPKNWSYDTILFKETWAEIPHKAEAQQLLMNNNDHIKKAIELGIFVKVQDNDHAKITTEIDRKNGWRIVREYPLNETHNTYTSIDFREAYATYDDAGEALAEIEAEYARQAALSDYDWSVEQIDKTLNRWAHLYSIPDDIKERTRQWILDRGDVENIETRLSEGGVQWKYESNKRWKGIEIL